jgi:lipoprotein NlpD
MLLAAVVVLAGCSSSQPRKAPVEDRGTAVGQSTQPSTPVAAPRPAAPAEAPQRPGYYTVKPGDTLIRIGLDTGQNWRDIARWNNIDNPNLIEVGQVLRVAGNVPMPAQPPVAAAEDATGVVTRPVTSSAIAPSSGASATAPVARGAASAAAPAAPAVPAVAASVPAPTAPAPVAAAPASAGEDELAFVWPVGGGLIHGFDDAKNKGLDLAGKQGDPVVAAADGRVVYAGAGLRGYGNLVILKHNNTYLTAYAHNHVLLVKEDQSVRKGQKIAEMGSSDADRVKLHFEVRRQGKPVDPAKYLPAR